jgi:hypothetical protein
VLFYFSTGIVSRLTFMPMDLFSPFVAGKKCFF